jgi:hypothetical protein
MGVLLSSKGSYTSRLVGGSEHVRIRVQRGFGPEALPSAGLFVADAWCEAK